MDGDGLFNSCLLGAGSCESNKEEGGYCAMHHDFDMARHQLIELYKNKTVGELATKAELEINAIVF